RYRGRASQGVPVGTVPDDQFLGRLAQPESFVLRQHEKDQKTADLGQFAQKIVGLHVQVVVDVRVREVGPRGTPQLEVDLQTAIQVTGAALLDVPQRQVDAVIGQWHAGANAGQGRHGVDVGPAQGFLPVVAGQQTRASLRGR